MNYITLADLTADSYQRFITESTSDIGDTLEKTEYKAIAFAATYIAGRYDVDLIFGLPWTAEQIPQDVDDDPETIESDLVEYTPSTPVIRDELLADIISKIVLYRIFKRNAPRKLTEDIKKDNEFAIDQLMKINSGRITLSLPLPKDENGVEQGQSIWGNSSNRDYYL
jgi:phage gp36-like protein